MTISLKTVALNTIFATIVLLAVAGAAFVPELQEAIAYTNTHLSMPMAIVFYFSVAGSFVLSSLLAALMLEDRLWSSGVKVGEKVARFISDTRNSLSSLFLAYVLVGAVNFLAVWAVWNFIR